MAHKLDFLLIGAARSGTTAFTQALNSHPDIFCAPELLGITDGHRRIAFPETFERQLSLIPQNMRADLAELLMRKRATATVIGSKNPIYNLVLHQLLKRQPDLKLVFMYRRPEEVLQSWNRRAADPDDSSWHRGQRGAFGVLALLSYMEVLLSVRAACLAVPYRAFANDVAGATALAARFLGCKGDATPDVAELVRLQASATALRDRSHSLTSGEAELLNCARLTELNAIFDRHAPFAFIDVKHQIRKFCHSIRGQWGAAFVEAVIAYDDPNAIKYLLKMLHKPVIAAHLAKEAAASEKLQSYLRSLPRALKLRRLLLRQSDLAICEQYLRGMRGAVAA
jgi:hypothetical protein